MSGKAAAGRKERQLLRVCVACSVASFIIAGTVSAQTNATARVTRTAVIVQEPRGDAVVVTRVPPGVVLEIVSQRGEWYQVRSINDGAAVRQFAGWIYRDLLEFLPGQRAASASPPVASSSQPAQPQAAPSQGDTQSVVAQPSVVPPTPAGGHPQVRRGFWFNVGLGYGSLGCDDCAGLRADGFSGGLALGGTTSDRVLLGLGTTGWARSVDGSTVSVGTLDFRVRFYPVVTSGFFLNSGVGLGTISVRDESEVGAGLMLGLGWDFRVGSNVSLTPFWNGSGVRTSNLNANFGQIGLGVTIH